MLIDNLTVGGLVRKHYDVFSRLHVVPKRISSLALCVTEQTVLTPSIHSRTVSLPTGGKVARYTAQCVGVVAATSSLPAGLALALQIAQFIGDSDPHRRFVCTKCELTHALNVPRVANAQCHRRQVAQSSHDRDSRVETNR